MNYSLTNSTQPSNLSAPAMLSPLIVSGCVVSLVCGVYLNFNGKGYIWFSNFPCTDTNVGIKPYAIMWYSVSFFQQRMTYRFSQFGDDNSAFEACIF